MSQSADYDALVARLAALADEYDALCPARIAGRVVACQDGHSHGCAVLPKEVAADIRARVIPPATTVGSTCTLCGHRGLVEHDCPAVIPPEGTDDE